MGVVEGEGEDDDPDLSTAIKVAPVSRYDHFLNSISAVTNSYQDSSASSKYLGNQAGNIITVVEDILVGTVWWWNLVGIVQISNPVLFIAGHVSSASGNIILVEEFLSNKERSWFLARIEVYTEHRLPTNSTVSIPAATSSYQDSSASSTYLGNQAGNILMVEDHLMGAEWWWNLSWAWVEVFMEIGRRTLLTSVLQLFLSSFALSEISPLFYNNLGITEIKQCTGEPGSHVGSRRGLGVAIQGDLAGCMDGGNQYGAMGWVLWGISGGVLGCGADTRGLGGN